ncbi:unnamed protein product [Rotaria magnacalcarata]|uniref:Uncharacterized protein n=1 Tax=Rotaria magnacalcarata TaxID=392030 RepID=A0A818Z3R2_9BILA|nr:unnamed protein product [Rotaria magnacalcarata]CAF1437801.1 unnamed protein product [Rotaria magnacalcarata]CAF2023286.1 unnamed protein product [Rotaria magnacalcarata]CAF2189660.1 unnamed protein product [Rotaria magnacalcarata]CAF2190082.1 unnamed protein product [Rotaria magnacalcarata]
MISNSTLINRADVIYYDTDNYHLPYEDDDLNNQTFYDEYIIINNQTLNLTNADVLSLPSIFSFSSPFSYIFLILIVYSVLTVILLSLSLYKQRQVEMENFYFGDTQEDIEKAKRCLVWKQSLIGKITKGDMEPLLIETYSNSNGMQSESKTVTFPLQIV